MPSVGRHDRKADEGEDVNQETYIYKLLKSSQTAKRIEGCELVSAISYGDWARASFLLAPKNIPLAKQLVFCATDSDRTLSGKAIMACSKSIVGRESCKALVEHNLIGALCANLRNQQLNEKHIFYEDMLNVFHILEQVFNYNPKLNKGAWFTDCTQLLVLALQTVTTPELVRPFEINTLGSLWNEVVYMFSSYKNANNWSSKKAPNNLRYLLEQDENKYIISKAQDGFDSCLAFLHILVCSLLVYLAYGTKEAMLRVVSLMESFIPRYNEIPVIADVTGTRTAFFVCSKAVEIVFDQFEGVIEERMNPAMMQMMFEKLQEDPSSKGIDDRSEIEGFYHIKGAVLKIVVERALATNSHFNLTQILRLLSTAATTIAQCSKYEIRKSTFAGGLLSIISDELGYGDGESMDAISPVMLEYTKYVGSLATVVECGVLADIERMLDAMLEACKEKAFEESIMCSGIFCIRQLLKPFVEGRHRVSIGGLLEKFLKFLCTQLVPKDNNCLIVLEAMEAAAELFDSEDMAPLLIRYGLKGKMEVVLSSLHVLLRETQNLAQEEVVRQALAEYVSHLEAWCPPQPHTE